MGVVTMSQVGGGGCWDHVPGGGEGGGCCDHVPGGEGGGYCDHVPGGGGGVVTWSMVTHLPPPKYYRMTDACENITFARLLARYAMRAVTMDSGPCLCLRAV